MTEKELREDAVRRYECGETAKKIYESLGKSKRWFFKWIKRYRSGEKNWEEEQSRKPHRIPKKIDRKMEGAVVAIRRQLEKELYAQIGALNISWHLEQRGITSPPLPTINKILKRNDLVRKRKKYQAPQPEHPETSQNIVDSDIHANHVEAFNAALRRRCAAFRRKTNTYAKKVNKLQERLNGMWIIHNFVRPHFTTKEVPAVAIGIIEKGMSFEDVLRFRGVTC